MPVLFNTGDFLLGIAVGVLGLVLLLSLIVSYAYSERSLQVLAAYLVLMVAAITAGHFLDVSDALIQRLLLIAGPAALSGFLARLLNSRRPARGEQLAFAGSLLVTLGLMGLMGLMGMSAAAMSPQVSAAATIAWFGALLGFSIYRLAQSWGSAGPWRWWLMLGHFAGLATAALFLSGAVDSRLVYWPVVLMLLVQVPPIYLSLVWRSRLLNESRLRTMSADVTDPLTGLATTTVLVERLMRVMSRAQQQASSRNTLFLIEVQNWQGLLNELGKDFQEKLLLEAAMRLRRGIGDNDLAARLAGGRFAVMAQGLDGEKEISSLATRLLVSGLRIDSPLLKGVEFKFRVIVNPLRFDRPLSLPQTHEWLTALADHFPRWPGSHRNRSILFLTFGNPGKGDQKDNDQDSNEDSGNNSEKGSNKGSNTDDRLLSQVI